jgi:hypothetical protein
MPVDGPFEAVPPRASRRAPRLLDWRSGGWLLAVSGVLCVATIFLWVQRSNAHPLAVGDGRDVSTYGFDLSPCLVPRAGLVAAGFPKDGIPALVRPEVFTVAEVATFSDELRRAHKGKYLLDGDLVIGVLAGGTPRAYPLRIVTWHEVVNDTLGGRPIAITYNPLCDSTVVFERQIEGETLEFGVSGLLYNSNVLMYDRRPDAAGESLWSQLQFRAIAGPAAARGAELRLLPAVVVRWQDWTARYPDTTVLAPDRSRLRVYENTYGGYFGSDRLRFPVEPLPPAGPRRLKAPILAVRTGARWHVFTLAELIRRRGASGEVRETLDGVDVRFACQTVPAAAVWAESVTGEPVQVVRCCWFAWYALHPPGAEWDLGDEAD